MQKEMNRTGQYIPNDIILSVSISYCELLDGWQPATGYTHTSLLYSLKTVSTVQDCIYTGNTHWECLMSHLMSRQTLQRQCVLWYQCTVQCSEHLRCSQVFLWAMEEVVKVKVQRCPLLVELRTPAIAMFFCIVRTINKGDSGPANCVLSTRWTIKPARDWAVVRKSQRRYAKSFLSETRSVSSRMHAVREDAVELFHTSSAGEAEDAASDNHLANPVHLYQVTAKHGSMGADDWLAMKHQTLAKLRVILGQRHCSTELRYINLTRASVKAWVEWPVILLDSV